MAECFFFNNHTLQQDELGLFIENQKNFSINSVLTIEWRKQESTKKPFYVTQNFGEQTMEDTTL